MERHVPERYGWVNNDNEAVPKVRCAILDVVSWFPGVLQQLWIGRQHAMPARRTLQRKCVETRSGWSCWGSGENEAIRYGRASVGLRGLMEDCGSEESRRKTCCWASSADGRAECA